VLARQAQQPVELVFNSLRIEPVIEKHVAVGTGDIVLVCQLSGDGCVGGALTIAYGPGDGSAGYPYDC
jgi:hypothetical protein